MPETLPAGVRRITSIHIAIIPHAKQRYPTVGDWQYEGPRDATHLMVKVSAMPDQRMEQAIAIHELVEALLCNHAGITQEEVDAWDIVGPGAALDDPGDDVDSPYHAQHVAATEFEERFVEAVGLTWDEHDNAINSIPED